MSGVGFPQFKANMEKLERFLLRLVKMCLRVHILWKDVEIARCDHEVWPNRSLQLQRQGE